MATTIGKFISKEDVETLIASQRPTSEASYLISGGGIALISNLNVRVSAAEYFIRGVRYTSQQTDLTLSNGDATNPRFDAIVVDDQETVSVIAGTPAASPTFPTVDPATQYVLTYTQIPAAATTLPSVVQTVFYKEATPETVTVSAGGRVVAASTNNPLAGTKCIEGTATVADDWAKSTIGAAVVVSAANQLVLNIRSKAAWPKAKTIQVTFFSGSTKVGQSVAIGDGFFGFVSATTTAYQQIIIPVGNFQVPAGATADAIELRVKGSGASIGWYADNLVLESTTVITTPAPTPKASSTVSGTVRTTTDDTDPVVDTSAGTLALFLSGRFW